MTESLFRLPHPEAELLEHVGKPKGRDTLLRSGDSEG